MKESYSLADLQNWEAAHGEDKAAIRLGIFGDPVAHSFSPRMQNAALQAAGLNMQYAAFQIRPEELAEALRLLPALNFVGVNLTIPHKIAAAGMVDELDEPARTVGAINTVRIVEGKLRGSNTDSRSDNFASRLPGSLL